MFRIQTDRVTYGTDRNVVSRHFSRDEFATEAEARMAIEDSLDDRVLTYGWQIVVDGVSDHNPAHRQIVILTVVSADEGLGEHQHRMLEV